MGNFLMSEEPPKAKIRKIVNAVAKALRPLGFARRGLDFTRPVQDGIVQIISFLPRRLYRSDSSESDEYDLICSAGVHVPAYWRAASPLVPMPPREKVTGGHWAIFDYVCALPGAEQAGAPFEPDGLIKANENTMAQLPRLIEFLAKDVVTWLDEFQSNDHIVQRYRKYGHLGPGPWPVSALTAAIIRASQGRMEEAEALFDEIRQGPRPGEDRTRPGHPGFFEHVNNMREAVGLKPYPIEELLKPWGLTLADLPGRSSGTARTAPVIRLSESEQAKMREHLIRLAELGLRPRRGVSVEDIAVLIDPESFTGNPVLELLAAFGGETEDERPRRICDRVLMLDSECIETRRDLVRVMKWLGMLTGKALAIREIKAGIDPLDELSFLVSFELGGRRFNWRLENNDDWLDPEMVLRYDDLLAAEGAGIGIYEVLLEVQGQEWLLVALAPGDERKLAELGQLTVRRVRELRAAE